MEHPFRYYFMTPFHTEILTGSCQELEVFHNPQAAYPIPFDLIPGATHWFEHNGDIECSSIWGNSILASVTHLRMSDKPQKTGDMHREGGGP
jgi:hypothetical protein